MLNSGATTVFTVSVDSTGKVTLTQLRAVVQGTKENPDIGETTGLSGNNKVMLNATITDGDGNSATASLDLTPQLLFKDVGPTITASATGEPTLTTTDPNSGSSSTANGAFAIQFTTNFGADGQATANSETFAFSNVSGVDSGVIDTATGQHVLLSGGGSQIVGTVNSGATPVFTVSVDSTGKVTLTQLRAVVQGTGENPDIGETAGLSGSNKVVLNATITDGDGDSATASLDLTPQLLFKDVGPTITASATGEPTLTTTDPNSGSSSTANGAFAIQFTTNFGADRQATANSETFAFSNVSGVDSGVIDTATGQHVLLSGGGSQIVGTVNSGATPVFTISVDSTGKVTLTQLRAVVQGTGENPDIGETAGLSGSNKVVLNATITDGDGDTANASLDLTPQLLFKDVGPSITASATGEPTLTTTDPNSGTSTANGAFGAQFTVNFNADGPAASNSKTFAFSNVSGIDSGIVDTATGQHVMLSGGGSQITGTVN